MKSPHGFGVAPLGLTLEPTRRLSPFLDTIASTEPIPDNEPNSTGLNFLFSVGGGVRWNFASRRRQWPLTAWREIMLPSERLRIVVPSTSVATALELMAGNDLRQLPAVSDGHLDGVMSRADILGYLQTRAEIQA